MAQLKLGLPEKKFAYIKEQTEVEGITVRQNEIGIIECEDEDNCLLLIIRINKRAILSKNDYECFDVTKIGDQYPKKVCNVCHRLLDTEQFAKNQNGKDNRTVRRPSCNDCRVDIDGVGLNSKEKAKWEARRPNLELFECPICKKITVPGLTSKIVLDHNHKDGSVRGWICDSCNTGIGRFKDDIDLLRRAIAYLEDQEKG